MLRTALQPRFLGLLALMIAATVLCGLLATWQWDRAQQALLSEPVDTEPAITPELPEVLDLGDPVTNELVGDTVSVEGTFLADEQVLVPGRRIEGTSAVIVVTALAVEQPDGSTARLPIARGWLPEGEVTGADGEIDASLAPAPPEGPVSLSGHLEASEAATEGPRSGTVREIATPLLVNVWGEPMYTGYIGQTTPAERLSPMPAAESAFSRGLDWQNVGYALQWVLFGIFFLYLWGRSVRTAYLDEQAESRLLLEEELEVGTSTPSRTETRTIEKDVTGVDTDQATP